MDLVAATTHRV